MVKHIKQSNFIFHLQFSNAVIQIGRSSCVQRDFRVDGQDEICCRRFSDDAARSDDDDRARVKKVRDVSGDGVAEVLVFSGSVAFLAAFAVSSAVFRICRKTMTKTH
jgi:hypothetical protein